MKLVFILVFLFTIATCATVEKLDVDTFSPALPRDGAVAVRGVENKSFFLMFGSIQNHPTPNNYTCLNDVHLFVEGRHGEGEWQQINTLGTNPTCRSFANAEYVVDANCIPWVLVYGGTNYTFEGQFDPKSDILWALNLVTYEWVDLSSITPNPGPRVGAGSASQDNLFYLYGGLGSDFVLHDDVWVFDIDTLQWTKLANDSGENGRYAFADGLVKLNGDYYLFMSMGESFFGLFNNTLLFSLETKTWTDVTPDANNNIVNGIVWASCAVSKNLHQVMCYGGDNRQNDTSCGKPSGDTTTTNKLYYYRVNQGKWILYQYKQNDDKIPPQKYGLAVTSGSFSYVTGGFSCNGDTQTHITDVYKVWN